MLMDQLSLDSGKNFWSLGDQKGTELYENYNKFMSFFKGTHETFTKTSLHTFNKKQVIYIQLDIYWPFFERFFKERPDLCQQIELTKATNEKLAIYEYTLVIPEDWDLVFGLLRLAGYKEEI